MRNLARWTAAGLTSSALNRAIGARDWAPIRHRIRFCATKPEAQSLSSPQFGHLVHKQNPLIDTLTLRFSSLHGLLTFAARPVIVVPKFSGRETEQTFNHHANIF